MKGILLRSVLQLVNRRSQIVFSENQIVDIVFSYKRGLETLYLIETNRSDFGHDGFLHGHNLFKTDVKLDENKKYWWLTNRDVQPIMGEIDLATL